MPCGVELVKPSATLQAGCPQLVPFTSASTAICWHLPPQIALDVARGLVFLHSRRVVHFDLKSPNILLARWAGGQVLGGGLRWLCSLAQPVWIGLLCQHAALLSTEDIVGD